MTAPIQEPSTDRALQGFAYQRDQLLRRPSAPFQGQVIGEAYKETNQIITSGNYTKLTTWDNWTVEDATIIDQATTGLHVMVAGWYHITAMVDWSTVPTDGECVVVIGGGGGVGENITELHSQGSSSRFHNRVSEIMYVEEDQALDLYVQHISGTNRTVTFATLKACSLLSSAPAPYWVPAQ